jgi:AraC-like DNA-binding protein
LSRSSAGDAFSDCVGRLPSESDQVEVVPHIRKRQTHQRLLKKWLLRRRGLFQHNRPQADIEPKGIVIPTPARIKLPWPIVGLATCLGANVRSKSPPDLWSGSPMHSAHKTRRRLVTQAERTVLAELHAPLKIAKLCRTLGVSQRYLRSAYQSVHGMPPLRYLRALKLSRARHALMSARSQSVSVAKIATRLGFRELGRFSVDYRKMFGESPSATLGRALRKLARKRTEH